jgi:signal transduction histidine kinase
MVNFISREAFVLSAIIDDLLVAARLEVGRLEVTRVPTSPHAQLAQVLETWEPEAIARVRIVGGEPKALADPGRVRQILRNLITNALRYGGDDVVVDLLSAAESVVVEVRDNGPGLPEEEWEKIFEPYYSSHTGATKPGSVGLGLTVSRRLAHLMGGDLTYKYQNGMSVFSFTLPNASVQA